ncbi:MAG: hypothetical protein E7161_00045 [Firmicutes bacterium]|nr:hypothetical protein [Bacillota bacterium]
MNSSLESIKFQLRKKAIVFETGGIRPTNDIGESWIGKVCWQNPNEQQPIGKNGKPMIPLATIFVEESDYVPKALKNIKMISIFMDQDINISYGVENYVEWFAIKTYESLEQLVPCNYTCDQIKPFPLVPRYVNDEFPLIDDIDDILLDTIEKVQENLGIEYDFDIFENNTVAHKLGGYPSSINGGLVYDKGDEFVLQIISDEKANIYIREDGIFYFGYNPISKEWSVICDYY